VIHSRIWVCWITTAFLWSKSLPEPTPAPPVILVWWGSRHGQMNIMSWRAVTTDALYDSIVNRVCPYVSSAEMVHDRPFVIRNWRVSGLTEWQCHAQAGALRSPFYKKYQRFT
jgi:hypothetical protein